MSNTKTTPEEQKKHRYRVRRGMWGVSVLQRLENVSSFVDGSSNAKYEWQDVSYNAAPRALTTSIED